MVGCVPGQDFSASYSNTLASVGIQGYSRGLLEFKHFLFETCLSSSCRMFLSGLQFWLGRECLLECHVECPWPLLGELLGTSSVEGGECNYRLLGV